MNKKLRHLCVCFIGFVAPGISWSQGDADPFANDLVASDGPKEQSTSYAMTVFEVPILDYLSAMMEPKTDPRDGHSLLYEKMTAGVGDGSVKLIRHEVVPSRSGRRSEGGHSREAIVPSYFNIKIGTLRRYNPRDSQVQHLRETFAIDPVVDAYGLAHLSYVFQYSPGERVTRFYGARYPKLDDGVDFPRFVELPAYPQNSVSGSVSLLPGHAGVQIVGVNRLVQPLEANAGGFKRPNVLHLCFVRRVDDSGGTEKRAESARYVFVWAAVYEIPAAEAGFARSIDRMPPGSRLVDLAGGTARLAGGSLQVRSSAVWWYPDAVASDSDKATFKGVGDAQGRLSGNLTPVKVERGIALKMKLEGTSAGRPVTIHYEFERAPAGPIVRERKFAYRDPASYSKNAKSRYLPVYFEQMEFPNESHKGQLRLRIGEVSKSIALKQEGDAAGASRVVFFGVN